MLQKSGYTPVHVLSTARRNVVVNAALQVRKVITLQKVEDMDFGIIDYAASYSGQVSLGSDGSVLVSGGSGLTPSGGTAKPAQVGISGDDISTAEVTCSDSGTMADGSGNLIPLESTEYALDTGVPPGSGTR